MDKAFCTIDEKEWSADAFYALPLSEIQLKRRSLLCIECKGDAWFRRSSYGNDSPHFCAHHQENCPLGTSYEAVGEGDENKGLPASDADSGIVLDLGLTQSYNIDVKPIVDDSDTTPHGQKFSGEKKINGGNLKYPAHFTLKNLLYKLVKSKGLCYTDKKVGFKEGDFNDLPERGAELFVEFVNVEPWMDGARRIFWGFISDVGQTKDGKIWLNAGNIKSGLSICINKDVSDDFKEQFRVEKSLDELDGCHALIIGTCAYATTGKPILWCGDLSYIVLRRYKSDQGL
ncbi:TPA: hypothetical protein SMF65_002905 [Serratia marcescens]|uniref:hypothetical protein n=1 Tax=Serratia marcescens TaxID=615 RepID=UPI0018D612A4|nr:hypothetical protein [Serratia marcescens]HEJ7125214.1 hypothetical protein [Serratia marcescens]HEJ7142829.1 hypothetical protein [Serratia marcescens]HEJ7223867.1 hypothetical protein [Serratia marcescens]